MRECASRKVSKMHGRFILPSLGLVLPNMVVDAGEESFLKMIFRADVTDVASGGNFYIGLVKDTPAETDTLATLTGEPSATNGYARIAVERDATGWPTIDQPTTSFRAVSKEVLFQASGGPIGPFTRIFLCNAASGTSGILFAVSAALPADRYIVDGEGFPVRYEFYLD